MHFLQTSSLQVPLEAQETGSMESNHKWIYILYMFPNLPAIYYVKNTEFYE